MDRIDQGLGMAQDASRLLLIDDSNIYGLGEVVHVDEGVGAAIAMHEYVDKEIGEHPDAQGGVPLDVADVHVPGPVGAEAANGRVFDDDAMPFGQVVVEDVGVAVGEVLLYQQIIIELPPGPVGLPGLPEGRGLVPQAGGDHLGGGWPETPSLHRAPFPSAARRSACSPCFSNQQVNSVTESRGNQ